MSKKRVWSVLRIIAVLLLITVAIQWLFPFLSSEQFKSFIATIGPFGPVIIILYIVISHVFAPVSSFPALLPSFAVFGFHETMIYWYIAGIISAAINFYLARRYGRTMVKKLVGEKAMFEIDAFVEKSGVMLLFLSRIFGFPLFEFISYAAGLTSISFSRYMTITVICSAVVTTLLITILRDIDFSKASNLMFGFMGLLVIGAIFTLIFRLLLLKRR